MRRVFLPPPRRPGPSPLQFRVGPWRRSSPARMRRSSWFLRPSCTDAAMFTLSERLHIDGRARAGAGSEARSRGRAERSPPRRAAAGALPAGRRARSFRCPPQTGSAAPAPAAERGRPRAGESPAAPRRGQRPPHGSGGARGQGQGAARPAPRCPERLPLHISSAIRTSATLPDRGKPRTGISRTVLTEATADALTDFSLTSPWGTYVSNNLPEMLRPPRLESTSSPLQ